MHRSIRWSLVLAGVATTGIARAECSVSADPGAVARPVSPTVPADANLLVSMTMVPKLMHLDYRAAAQRPACDLGPLAAGDDAYELWGGDAGGRQRKALPKAKGGPVVMMVPVFDIMKAVDGANTGKPAAIAGYMLATVTKDDLTGWRFYTAMPDVTVLKHDMAAVLTTGAKPLFRNGADGKTALFVGDR